MNTPSSNIMHSTESKQVVSRKRRQINHKEILLKGRLEIEVSEGGEADLHRHLVGCQKNPGHTMFIPVKTFKMQDLPKDYRHYDLYEWIKATADLTVRVEVKMTSPHRPKFCPDTNDPYPFYNMRNKTTLRLGTGEIHIWKFTDGRGVDADGNVCNINKEQYVSQFGNAAKTCPCTNCQHSDKPNNVWWEIEVYTATHVVFDDIEASHTSCRLFYDEQDSPVVSLDKISIHYLDTEMDWCELKYVTCDSLGDKLYNMAVHREAFLSKIRRKYNNKSHVNFIVSHPHGCHKHVSIGQLTNNEKVSGYNKKYDKTQLFYTTCTCPGSSGARVHCLGSHHVHFHRGALNSGLNYSCKGFNRK